METYDDEVLERYPAVRLDYDNIEFYRGLLEQRYLVCRCSSCGDYQAHLSPLCSSCWAADVQLVPIAGDGRIALLTFFHSGPEWPGVDYSTPYPLAAVELVEQPGLRITATVVTDGPVPEVGMAVELTWTRRDGNPYPAFRPAVAGASS